MCDISSLTRTKVSGTLCKPCENRVKVVFNRTRPYLELYNSRMYSYANRVQTLLDQVIPKHPVKAWIPIMNDFLLMDSRF